ncbi:MAG: sensor domain-containing diguanylate cyclase [Chloroflexia bacterium]
MSRTRSGVILNRIAGFPPWAGIWKIPNSKLDTLKWVLAIKTNVAVGLLFVMLITFLLPDVPVENLVYLTSLCLVYIGFNCAITFALSRNPSDRSVRIFSEIFIPVEVALSTLSIYFTGGALTPMFIVYTLGIMMSIILLTPSGVYKIATISILQYCALVGLEAYRVIPRLEITWGGQKLYAEQNFYNYASYLLVVCATLIATGYMGNRIARLIGQRNARIESQVWDLRAINDVSRTLSNMMDDREIVRYLASTLAPLNNATTCIIASVDTEGRPEIAASAGLSPAELARLRTEQYQHLPGMRALFEQGEPLVLEDLEAHKDFQVLLPAGRDLRSLYSFPVIAEEKVLGAISLAFDKPGALSEEYCDLLKTIANQAGVAIQRARLFRDLQRLAHEMSTLYSVGLHTGSTLSRGEVIKRTATNMERLLSPDMYYIALYNDETHAISFEHFKEHGQMMPMMKTVLGPQTNSLTGTIIRSKEALLVRDWLNDGRDLNSIAQKTGSDMLSYLGVPMIFDNRVIGALSVQCVEPNAFNEDSQRLLEAMAAQTAMALENARLHEVAQLGATMDSLTKVYNHGRFVELVHESISESDKKGSQVSLIMLDIDYFKQYNDTYGHVAGDNVLALVADALKRSVREDDVVGRWGGEEFGVLLPGLDREEAKRVARRIRREVAKLMPVDGQERTITSPTISQGLSTYPFPSSDATSLIEDADAALYFAKEHGRNQMVILDRAGVHDGTREPRSAHGARFTRCETTTGHLSGKLALHDVTATTGNLSKHAAR